MNRIFRSVLLLAMPLMGVAAPVTSDEAAQAVRAWVGLRAQLGCRLGAAVSGTRTCVPTNGVTFHVVKLEGGGFVVTSSDTETEPILAFSESDDFVESERNPLWTMLRRDLSACVLRRRQVQFAAAGASSSALSAPAAKWARLLPAKGTNGLMRVLQAATGKETLSDVRVAPLLQTKWNQEQDAYYSNMGDPCYNYYTPNNFPCGCVATATAQIMRYHRFPTGYVTPGTYACRVETGKDWINEWSYYPIYEDRNLTMQGGYYEWDKMPLVPADGTTLAQRQAIGKLTSDVGITCLMSYGEGGSSSGGYMAARSLPGRFGYASAVAACGGISAAFVRKALVSNLDAKLPVLLGVSGGLGGHAVVADGYGYSMSTFYAHFNLGWGGRNDAWYAPPNVEDYNSVDSMVYNIYPNGAANGVICSGRVLSQSGTPVKGATVAVSGKASASAVTDASGVYAFILAPGSYEVSSGDASRSVTLVANVGTSVTDNGYYYSSPVAAVNNVCDLDLTVSGTVPPQEEDPSEEEPVVSGVRAGTWTTDVDAVKAAGDCRMVVVLCANYGGCGWSQRAQPVFESKKFLNWAAENGVYLVTSDGSRLPAGCTDANAASSWFWTLYGSVSHPDGYVYYPTVVVARPDNFNQAVGYDVVRDDGKCTVGGLVYGGTADSLIAGLSVYLNDAGGSEAKVVFNAAGGRVVPSRKTVRRGGSFGELPVPERTGYSFAAWWNEDYGGKVTADTIVKSDEVELTALWTANTYSVRFDANGGEGRMSELPGIAYDTRTTLPPCSFFSSDQSMRFRGWATEPEGRVAYRDRDQIVNLTSGNGVVVTLYAVWDTTPDGFGFETSEVSAAKGRSFRLTVYGGSDKTAASVKLNVAYANAKAADLVLKTATVSGANGVEKKNLKLPLTLSWAAGDTEPKTIVIPVAAGKATDAPKFLTWNLTGAKGLALGERISCLATIAAGAKWNGGDVYVMPIVAGATGGKVSGGASVKPDKKGAYKAVTLKATANKGYWFAGWYGADGEWTSGDLSFKVMPDGSGPLSKYEARFVKAKTSLCATYSGYARVNLRGMSIVKKANTSGDVVGEYPLTATLSTAGKLSGSITVGGKKVSFKADGCREISDDGEDDEWVTFRFPVEEKSWFGKGNVETLQLEVSRSSSAGKYVEYGVARLGGVSSSGAYAPLGDEQSGFACRNIGKSDVKLLAPFVGSYAAALDYGDEGVIPLSISIDKSGKVKAAGKHLDGTALAMNGVLVYRFANEAWETGTDPYEDAIVHLFAVPKALGGGSLHVTASLTYRRSLRIVDIETYGKVTRYVASGVRTFDESSTVSSRFSSSCWFPADADPDFGVVRLTSGGDTIDILYASKNGKITGLGKALQSGFTVKFDAKTGLLTVTKGKAYTIQGVLGDCAGSCCGAGRINKDKTCEPVGIEFTTLPTPEEIFPWTDNGFALTLGQNFGKDLQPSALSEGKPLALTVSGLPAGLKYDKKTGLITGAPTKAGTFKVKVGYTYATRKITRTATLVVLPKPEGLPVGTYAGYATVYVDGVNKGQRVDCPFTATIDKNGALSGSITLFGKKVTFKASGYDSGSVGSSVYTATLSLKPVGKTWGTTALSIRVEGNGMSADPGRPFGGGVIINGVVAYRNQTKDKGYADRVAPYVGTYVAALSTAVDAARYGVTTLSVAVDKKGTAKLAGTFVDGTTFSGSASLVLSEVLDGEWASVDVCVAPKSLSQGAMRISLTFDAENGAVALTCSAIAAKYVRTAGEYVGSSLVCDWAYRYASLAWVDGSVSPKATCLSVRCENGSFGEALFAWKTKMAPRGPEITGVGKKLSGPTMTFKIDDKTGLFSGTCGSYKIFGAMEKGACSGIGTAVGKNGRVDWVWVEVAAR